VDLVQLIGSAGNLPLPFSAAGDMRGSYVHGRLRPQAIGHVAPGLNQARLKRLEISWSDSVNLQRTVIP
jgi:hypothetical protein